MDESMVNPVDSGQLGIGKSADLEAYSELSSGLRSSIREAIQTLKLAWETIENVPKISRTVSVNEFQCTRIGERFRDVGKILQALGLDKTLYGSGRSEERFWDIAKPIGMIVSDILKKRNLPASDSDESDLKLKVLESLEALGFAEVDNRHLILLVDRLYKELRRGEELVKIHLELKEVNNSVISQTGLRGDNIVRFHQRLTHLLFLFDTLYHTPYSTKYKLESSISNRYYISNADKEAEQDRMFIYYLNSNCLKQLELNTTHNLEVAEAVVRMLKRPDSVLERLIIGEKSVITIDNMSDQQKEDVSRCRLMVIGALARSSKLTCCTINATTEEEVREMSKSVAANRALEKLNMYSLTILGDHDADILAVALKENQSVKAYRLQTRGISPKGAASFGAMLAENSTLEELTVSDNSLGGVGMKNLLSPLMANENGKLPANTSLKHLHIGRNEIGEQTGGVSAVAQTLRTNKTLTHFSMLNEKLGAAEACEILKSLEINKTLQELDVSGCSGFDDVYVEFMDLLVKHNFTLRTINSCSVNDFIVSKLKPYLRQQRRHLDYIDISKLILHSIELDELGIRKLLRLRYITQDIILQGGLDTELYEALLVKVLEIYNPKLSKEVDQEFGYQRTLERHSKASLEKMNSFLENNFMVQRRLNELHKLQHKYIEQDTFKEMCFDAFSRPKDNFFKYYGKGRTTAAFFPNTFLFYFKALIIGFEALYFKKNEEYLPYFLLAANMAARSWKNLCGHVQQSFYIDVDPFIDVGHTLSSGGVVALCKNLQEKEDGDPQGNSSTQYGIEQDDVTGAYGIGQDDLTGAYFCGRFEESALREAIHEAIGVIGVRLKSPDIHIEDMSEDGSYYSGKLKDFSCEFGLDKNNGDPIHKQCAKKAFDHLEGASFLDKNHGIKCSPLLLIALASASQRKGLNFNWNDKYGHIEIDPELACSQPSESVQCQILFTSKIKELGVAVVWGMGPMALDPQSSGASPYFNEAPKIGGSVDNGKKQIAHDSQSGDTSNHSVTVTDCAAVYGAASQDKKKYSVEGKGLGSGGSVSWECQDRKAHDLKALNQDKLFEFHWKGEGGYEEQNVPHATHGDLKTHLIQGALHAAKLNYLVVYDDIVKSHVSIYCVKEGEGEDELEWITDVFLKKGQQQCEDIFKDSLKGKDLTINRVSTTFTSITPANKLTGFFSLFKKKTNIVEGKMIELLDLGPKGSKDEWEHLIGLQENRSGEEKFWWQASFMQAILCSRTRFSTGKLLTTRTSVEKGIPIGHCQELDVVNPAEDYKHGTTKVIARGKFSRAPASQGARILYWGGLKNLQ